MQWQAGCRMNASNRAPVDLVTFIAAEPAQKRFEQTFVYHWWAAASYTLTSSKGVMYPSSLVRCRLRQPLDHLWDNFYCAIIAWYTIMCLYGHVYIYPDQKETCFSTRQYSSSPMALIMHDHKLTLLPGMFENLIDVSSSIDIIQVAIYTTFFKRATDILPCLKYGWIFNRFE